MEARCAIGFFHVLEEMPVYNQLGAECADAMRRSATRTELCFTLHLTGNVCYASKEVQLEQQDSPVRCHHCVVEV